MGLLDQVIGSVLGSRAGPARGGGGGMSPLAMALIALLASRALGQGGLGGMLGGILGGGGSGPGGADEGSPRGHGRGGAEDFAGMLDGPGGSSGGGFNTGGYAGAGMGGAEAGGLGGALGGGLGGLIERFQQNGLGDVIGSWIGHGPNQHVSPQQLHQALGDDTIDALQQQTGMPRGDLLSELAHILPGVVDQLTPHGRPPSQDEIRHW